jgi:hypothetical protein
MVEAKKLLSSDKQVTEGGQVYWILTFYMEATGEIKVTTVYEDPSNLLNAVDLPAYVQSLPLSGQAKWSAIFKDTAEREGNDIALLVANLWLQRYLKEDEEQNGTTLERISFEVDTDAKELVTRSENGQEYISFKLADVMKDQFGVQLNGGILQKWADKINGGSKLQGDIDHEEYDRLLAMGLSEEEMKERLVGKNGLATAVQAIYEKGKLWVRALIDKRYKKAISKAQGVSMEALIERDNQGNVLNGELLGWTFAVKDTPGVEGTTINM